MIVDATKQPQQSPKRTNKAPTRTRTLKSAETATPKQHLDQEPARIEHNTHTVPAKPQSVESHGTHQDHIDTVKRTTDDTQKTPETRSRKQHVFSGTVPRIRQIALLSVVIIIGACGIWGLSSFVGARFDGFVSGGSVANANSTLTTDQINSIVRSIQRLIVLPPGQPDIVATVSDATLLSKQQNFYHNAKNGDVLVVYQAMQQAYLYRPSANILVNVGPVVMDTSATTTQNVRAATSSSSTSTPTAISTSTPTSTSIVAHNSTISAANHTTVKGTGSTTPSLPKQTVRRPSNR